MATPRDKKEIVIAFYVHFSRRVGQLVSETEAAIHGESDPGDPAVVDAIMAMVPENPTRELFYLLLGASGPAAADTVHEFCGPDAT